MMSEQALTDVRSDALRLLSSGLYVLQQFQMWFSSTWRQAQAHEHEVQEVFPACER